MKEYEITPADGAPTTVLLSDEDAAALGLKPVERKAKAPENKARTDTANKRAEAVAKAFNAPKKADG